MFLTAGANSLCTSKSIFPVDKSIFSASWVDLGNYNPLMARGLTILTIQQLINQKRMGQLTKLEQNGVFSEGPLDRGSVAPGCSLWER